MARIMELLTSGVKYSMFFFNFLFVITGIVILSVGAVIQAEYTKYHPLLSDQFFSLPSFLIATGAFIFIIAFFGCCGAVKENYCMILTFAVLMVMIFIFELAGGISGYVLKGRTKALLQTTMLESMNYYGSDSSTHVIWDVLHEDLDCCGTNNYTDWKNVVSTNHAIPLSCCDTSGASGNFNCTSESPTVHKIGCLDQLSDWARSHAGTLGGVGLALAILQVLAIIFACYLARKTKYETMA